MKRLVTLLLVLCICASVPGFALAETTEPKEVVLWMRVHEEWFTPLIAGEVEKYNSLNRGYHVTVDFVAEAAWNERITAAQAGGSAPDVYMNPYNVLATEAKNQTIQPLNGLLSDDKLNDIIPAVRDMVTYNGQVYGYPLWTEPSALLYYRKDMFEEANIEKVPTTWDEWLDVAVKLTNDDRFGLILPNGGDFGWSTWGWQYGLSGHLAISDNWDAATIDEGYRNLALFYQRAYESGAVPEQALCGYGDITPLATGAVAMQVNGSWAVATLINDYPELEGKYGIAVCPTIDGNQDVCTATTGGWMLTIDGKAKQPEGAADFISYLCCEDPSVWAQYFENCCYSRSACNQTLADYVSEKSSTIGYEWADAIIAASANAIPEPLYPWDISCAVQLMVENVYMGILDVDEAMEACINSINAIIEAQGLAGNNPKK